MVLLRASLSWAIQSQITHAASRAVNGCRSHYCDLEHYYFYWYIDLQYFWDFHLFSLKIGKLACVWDADGFKNLFDEIRIIC